MENKSTTQNVTLSLRKEILQRAKIIAVKRNTSLSALLNETLEKLASEEEGYQQAQDFCLREMQKGYYMGAKPDSTSRDALHARG